MCLLLLLLLLSLEEESFKNPKVEKMKMILRLEDLALDCEAIYRALQGQVELYMDKFMVEFRVDVEVDSQKSRKQRILDSYARIHAKGREDQFCYKKMEKKEDEGGSLDEAKYVLPPGKDWKTMYHTLHLEHHTYTEDLIQYFGALFRFLEYTNPNVEYVMRDSDLQHIRASYQLIFHMAKV